ncbi:MAG: hypothetical protein M1816_003817 [Peltula sp. TS41687]|nr:MAG: hypothetical protein M1816_003817 [Peltula sp. TS41687]
MTDLKPTSSQTRSSQLGPAQLGISPPAPHPLHLMKTNTNNNAHPSRPSLQRNENGSNHRMSEERANSPTVTVDQRNGQSPIPVRPGPHGHYGNGNSRRGPNHGGGGGGNSFEGPRSPPGGSKSLNPFALPP